MEIEHAFTVLWYERVKIYHRANSLGKLISDPSNYDATVRVSAENYIREILPSEQVDNIRNMRRKVDSRRVEVRAFTESGKGRSKHLLAGVLKVLSDSLPTPATMPCPVHKHVGVFVLF